MIRRRAFLQRLGLAGLATGLSPLALSRALAADGIAGAPKRVIFISHCHGWPYDAWKMRPDGVDASAPWEADLSSMSLESFSQPLAPLFPHRARMLALDGLSLATAELDMDGNRHDTGWVHAWTGSWADFSGTDTKSWAPSIDQLLIERVARDDRLPSLELSVNGGLEHGRPISYAPSGVRLPVESDPAQLWQRLFGPTLNPDPLAARQQSALDFAHAEYSRLAPKLSGEHRDRLDAHFALVHQLGARIEGMANLACDAVPEPSLSQANYDARFDAFSELIGAAFSCDITRIVSLSLGEMPTADFGWDHVTDDVHKGLAHGIYDDADKHQAMADFLTRHAEQVARLVSLLEQLPDSDGGSVMDNTLIVWGSELADGWHGYEHYCPVLIGGSWHFKTGRYLYWPHETPIEVLARDGYTSACGIPHQRMLVSVAQAMGLETNHVGIEHVQGQTGHIVNCRDPLVGLT
jgi:hypothetical protein